MVNKDGGLPNFSNSVDFVRPTKQEKDTEHSHRVCKFIGAPNTTNSLEQTFSRNCPDPCRYVQNKLAHASSCSKPNHTHVFKILRTFITQPKLTWTNFQFSHYSAQTNTYKAWIQSPWRFFRHPDLRLTNSAKGKLYGHHVTAHQQLPPLSTIQQWAADRHG